MADEKQELGASPALSPSAPISIREANHADADIVVSFIERLISELDGQPWHHNPEISKRLFQQFLSDPEHAGILLAVDAASRPVGVLTFGVTAAIYAGGSFAIIHELYVAPTARSHRVGERLIDALKGLGKRNGWTRIEVGAPDATMWMRTIAFYRRLGFLEIGPRLKLILPTVS